MCVCVYVLRKYSLFTASTADGIYYGHKKKLTIYYPLNMLYFMQYINISFISFQKKRSFTMIYFNLHCMQHDCPQRHKDSGRF